jgi:hypothetical protein
VVAVVVSAIGLALLVIAMSGVGREEHRRIEEEERRRLGVQDPPNLIVDPLKGLLTVMVMWPLILVRSFRGPGQ